MYMSYRSTIIWTEDLHSELFRINLFPQIVIRIIY